MRSTREEILGRPDYGEFARALRASGCDLCPLAAGRTNLVVDRGNPAARILAVGEGPGAEEDATGRAFVGRGGRLLDRVFAEAGFDTNEDLLIANVVKCRPPGNRAPTRTEAAACLPYLRRQIDLVDPAAIVLLGATAVKHLLPGLARTPMKDLVGREITDLAWPGRRFLVLFHPAYILRDPRKLPLAREHLARLRGWFPR
jgi:DNA polymerase